MLVYIFSHERPGERSCEVIGCYFKESMQRWREQLSGKRAERAKTQIYPFDQSILANVKQNVSLLKEGLQDHALLCKSLYFPRKVENCSRDLLEFVQKIWNCCMWGWYLYLYFISILMSMKISICYGMATFYSPAWPELLAKVCFVISLSSLQEEFSRFLDIQSSSLDVGGLFSVLCQHT